MFGIRRSTPSRQVRRGIARKSTKARHRRRRRNSRMSNGKPITGKRTRKIRTKVKHKWFS